jgi:hypothetical protein
VEAFTEFAWLYLLIKPGGPIFLEGLGFYHRLLWLGTTRKDLSNYLIQRSP